MTKKHERIIGDDRKRMGDSLRQKYEKGASIRQLSDQTGRSFGWVHKVLKEAGASLRSRGGPNR